MRQACPVLAKADTRPAYRADVSLGSPAVVAGVALKPGALVSLPRQCASICLRRPDAPAQAGQAQRHHRCGHAFGTTLGQWVVGQFDLGSR